jgi:hypothetical protein
MPAAVRITLIALAALGILGIGLVSGFFLRGVGSRFMPEVFGSVGPVAVPAVVDATLTEVGALHVGDNAGNGAWKNIRLERPIASTSDLCLSIRWEAESFLSAWVWIRLGETPDPFARVEIQRSSVDGTVYSHGRGITGSVRTSRTTIPKGGDGPMVIEFVLNDYDGGSECRIRQRVALRAEDFR